MSGRLGESAPVMNSGQAGRLLYARPGERAGALGQGGGEREEMRKGKA